MGIKSFPGKRLPGNYSIGGSLIVDASGYITGPLQGATGLIVGADASFARRLDCATGIDVCGNVVAATALTVCGVAQ